MIARWSKLLTTYLIQNHGIKEEDRELYEYAVYRLFLSLQPLLFALVLGLVTGKIERCILIILPFTLIRKFAGGYHAGSTVRCLISSFFLLSITLLISFYYPGGWKGLLLMIGGGISVIICSPIDHENKRIDKEEKREFKRITARITTIWMILSVLSMWRRMEVVSICISLGILLTAVLQTPCVISRRKN